MADGISVAISGLKEFFGAIDDQIAAVDRAAKTIVAKGSAMTIAAAMANFEGAHAKGMPHVGGPKPNIVTGYLRRSIVSDGITRHGYAEYSSSIGPTAIYGRRIELGWHNSTAYPYFTPAAKGIQPKLEALADELWRSIVS